MELKLKHGIDNLLFGMKEQDVTKILGKPDTQYKDEEENVVFMYNSRKLRLIFYKEEDFKLGYLTTTNPMVKIFHTTFLGKNWSDVYPVLEKNKLKVFETDTSEGMISYFNEENWLFIHIDYNEIVKIELGAVFSDKDEFDWKF
jgi:preprotein translocase subunit Sec61beta